jgi:hypothetical protein
MSDEPQSPVNRAILRIMRPLVRVMLRNGLAYADFAALVKGVFVEVASEEFDLPGKKQSVSRISVLTGINRKEVKRLLELPPESADSRDNNRAARVVSGWMRDDDFIQADGSARPLPLAGTDSAPGFDTLVKRYSGDMPVRSILDELVRVGAARVDDGEVQLTASGYVPNTSNDEMLRLSAEGASDLLKTIDHNLHGQQPVSRLQLSVAYDDVPQAGVELFRNLSREKSLELLKQLDRFLATQDRSVNPSVSGDGRYRTGLGIYYFEEPIEPDGDASSDEPDSKSDKENMSDDKSKSRQRKR